MNMKNANVEFRFAGSLFQKLIHAVVGVALVMLFVGDFVNLSAQMCMKSTHLGCSSGGGDKYIIECPPPNSTTFTCCDDSCKMDCQVFISTPACSPGESVHRRVWTRTCYDDCSLCFTLTSAECSSCCV